MKQQPELITISFTVTTLAANLLSYLEEQGVADLHVGIVKNVPFHQNKPTRKKIKPKPVRKIRPTKKRKFATPAAHFLTEALVKAGAEGLTTKQLRGVMKGHGRQEQSYPPVVVQLIKDGVIEKMEAGRYRTAR